MSFQFGQWTKDEYEEYLNNKKYRFLALKQSNMIIGFFLLYIGSEHRYSSIYSLAIDPKFRGQQHGIKMLNVIFDICKQHKAPGIKLEVSETNDAAINIYKALNFKKVKHIKDYYDIGLHAIEMKLRF